MSAVSLIDLQQQIAQRERELQALRQELESRQSHLTELTRRREELQRQLQQVDEEITALARTTPTEKESSKAAASARATFLGGQPLLGELIVTLLREAARPMTARQVCEEAQRRGYQLSSQKPLKSVEARLQDLKHQGVVQRASGQPGFILAPPANGARKAKRKPSQPAAINTPKTPSEPAKSEPASKKGGGKGTPAASAAGTAKPGRRRKQPPLREVLTGVLKNSRKPLSARELAEQILATGYHSDSKTFVNVVWTMLGKMKNIERVPEKGFRLRRS